MDAADPVVEGPKKSSFLLRRRTEVPPPAEGTRLRVRSMRLSRWCWPVEGGMEAERARRGKGEGGGGEQDRGCCHGEGTHRGTGPRRGQVASRRLPSVIGTFGSSLLM